MGLARYVVKAVIREGSNAPTKKGVTWPVAAPGPSTTSSTVLCARHGVLSYSLRSTR